MDEETKETKEERILDHIIWIEEDAVNELMTAIRLSDQERGFVALGKIEALLALKKLILEDMHEEKLS